MSANEQMADAEGLDFVPYTRPTGTDTAEPLKIGVLISGSGTNLQALIDLIAADKLNASIELVVSSRPSAKGLQRAERAGKAIRLVHLAAAMRATIRFQNVVIKIFHAEAQTCHTDFADAGELRLIERARLGFKRYLRRAVPAHEILHAIRQIFELWHAQIARCAAAEIDEVRLATREGGLLG